MRNVGKSLRQNDIFTFYIIKQLFLQIMCKIQFIQVNDFQEIMNNLDLPLVLTHPPKEVRRLDLCRRWLISSFYVFQVNIGLNYTCIIFIFFNLRLHVFQVQFCCFRIGRNSAQNYRAFETIDILFYEHPVQVHIS